LQVATLDTEAGMTITETIWFDTMQQACVVVVTVHAAILIDHIPYQCAAEFTLIYLAVN